MPVISFCGDAYGHLKCYFKNPRSDKIQITISEKPRYITLRAYDLKATTIVVEMASRSDLFRLRFPSISSLLWTVRESL